MTPPPRRPRGLRRASYNLTPRGQAALAQAMAGTGDSQTDVINRAVPVYALVLTELAPDGRLRVLGENGEVEVYVI